MAVFVFMDFPDLGDQNIQELLRLDFARRRMINFASHMQPTYIWNWHHERIAEALDKFFKGEIRRLMVFIPPQHSKLLDNITPVLTPSGWTMHGNLKEGDTVFGRYGQPVKVLQIKPKSFADYQITFTDGEQIRCNGSHEWVVYDRSSKTERRIETKDMLRGKLHSGTPGKRGCHCRYMVDANTKVDFPERKDLPLHPYVLGAWLGDGTKGTNVITHDKKDLAHIAHIHNLGYSINSTTADKNTGALISRVSNLTSNLRTAGALLEKHIPENYLIASYEQRLQLLAGLIDSDGYVYHKNGRITFSNCNSRLIEDVRQLVISLGCRVTVCKFKPAKKSKDWDIQGKQDCYQLCFNPTFDIPMQLPRKKLIKLDSATRRRGIQKIESIAPVEGNCITVEGGIYLVGNNLIPTHNSEFTSRLFPAYALGKNPDLKLVLASYSASLAESMNRDVQRYIDSEEYAALFPNTKLQAAGANGKYIRNAERFDIVDHRGYFKSVGVGGSLTGTPADIAIIDDPHKDDKEAKSGIISQSVWDWYVGVLKTRLHNDSGVLLIQTRWDVNDLAGRLLQQMEDAIKNGETDYEKWTIICYPAIKENDSNPEDPRNVGDALWPAKHNLQRLNQAKSAGLRLFQSLYQQNPMPVQAGGECYKEFDVNANMGDFTTPVIDMLPNPWLYNPEIPLHFSFDFNVNPYMSCGVFQVHKTMNGDRPYYRVVMIEEICLRSPQNTTKGVCRHIRDKYGYRHLSTSYVYGDPNGMKEDTRSEKGHNDYLIIRRELANFKPGFRVATKAPAVATRIGFMNAIFSFSIPELEFFIDAKCTNAKNDFLYIKEESDGSKQKVKAIDPITGINSERYGHISDLVEYMACMAFPNIYARYQQGGKGSDIVLGKRTTRHGAGNY